MICVCGSSNPDKQHPLWRALCAVFLLYCSFNMLLWHYTLEMHVCPISDMKNLLAYVFAWEITFAASNLKHISCLYVPCRTEFVWSTNNRKYVSTGIHGQLKYHASKRTPLLLPLCTSLWLFFFFSWYCIHRRSAYIQAVKRWNSLTLSQSVFIVQTAMDCVGRPQRVKPCVQCAATTVSDPVKHVRNQGSFQSDWFTAFIAL